MDLPTKRFRYSVVVLQANVDVLIVFEDLNGLDHEIGVVHLSPVGKADLKKSLQILVFNHFESESVEIRADCIFVHLFLDEDGNNAIVVDPQTCLLLQVQQFQP